MVEFFWVVGAFAVMCVLALLKYWADTLVTKDPQEKKERIDEGKEMTTTFAKAGLGVGTYIAIFLVFTWVISLWQP